MGTEGAAKVWQLSGSGDPAEDYWLFTLQGKDLSLHSLQGREKKHFTDPGDVSSCGFPHCGERKGKNDRGIDQFID